MSKIDYDPEAVQSFVDSHFGEFTHDNRGQLHLMCPFCQGGQHVWRSQLLPREQVWVEGYRHQDDQGLPWL